MQLVLDHFGIKLQPGIPPQHEALDDAILATHLDIIKMFLDAGFDVNMRYREENYRPSLLDLAADSIDPLRTVGLLLERGADPEARSPHDGSILLSRLISISSMGEARMFVIWGSYNTRPIHSPKTSKASLHSQGLHDVDWAI